MLFWIGIATLCVQAETVCYTLNNVMLDDGTQVTGFFSWVYTPGDFENGAGQFLSLDIPWTSHDHPDLNATFDIGSSIEITLEGSVHDDGVDITLFLTNALTPTTASWIDLARSLIQPDHPCMGTGCPGPCSPAKPESSLHQLAELRERQHQSGSDFDSGPDDVLPAGDALVLRNA